MLKPFTINGHHIDGDLLKQMEQNGLNKNNVFNRICVQKWTLEEAVSTKKGEKRAPRPFKPRQVLASSPVKHYFLSKAELDEVHRKYGMPGQHCKDYGDNKQPIALRGAWHG
ncbi:hypothetical protein [Sporolactobacillus terrae]|uniref:hypothetical protein n=1 Tax=Sporolactobacillus terrae TaxID=269673 RepID=UPI001CC0C4EE|nr:hypothetical protein [Sporolactobacillus terrae]UAK17580.1 hypothetical protein K7399_06545 [Sporolactobacillus terrae]